VLQGGAEYQAYMLAEKLAEQGHEVSYIFIHDGSKLVQSDTIKLKPIKEIPFSTLSSLRILYAFPVYSILKNLKPDYIYHRNLSSFCWIATLYAKFHKTKTILHISHDHDVGQFRWSLSPKKAFRNIDNWLKFKGLRKVDTIICQSAFQQEKLMNNYHKDSTLIRNFFPSFEFNNEIKKEDIVVWIANIKKIKNPLAFVELVKCLEHKGYRFIMIGRPPDERSLRDVFTAALLASPIEYLGEVSNVQVNNMLLKAKILCCTSFSEGFPNTFIQAWLRKVPVVSLYVDPDNIIKTKKIGFHSLTLDQMTRDIAALMGNPSLLEKMGLQAQLYAREYHSFNAIFPRILKIFS
jgi:glycosyltransferase involved in cell wall biosynthesis